ncbi:MAG: hypothetical protein H0W81_01575 [Chloroflexi bacterium]|nr:hypothetical protein [Chloroflexota bacterium]
MAQLRILSVFLLALGALLGACSSPAGESFAGAPSIKAVEPVAIHVADFMLDNPDLSVTGPTVTFMVTNDGPTPHNVAVRNAEGVVLMTTRDLSLGESQTISAQFAPGDYITFCSLPGHESLGVKGRLSVIAP